MTIARTATQTFYRRLVQLVLGLFIVVSAVCGMMVVNAALGDFAISRDRGTAVAEVVNTGDGAFGERANVLVRYRDESAVYHSPESGLKYPTGLEKGDRVRVEYQRSDTDTVKVMGRSWTLSIVPALSVWAVSIVVTVLVLMLIRWRWTRRVRREAALVEAGPNPTLDSAVP